MRGRVDAGDTCEHLVKIQDSLVKIQILLSRLKTPERHSPPKTICSERRVTRFYIKWHMQA